jgi:hypothetical protein
MPVRQTLAPRALLVFAILLTSCKGARSGGAPSFDADPLLLVPSSVFVVANVDARATFDNPSVGATLAAAVQGLVPLPDEAGLQASRDVDRVIACGFSAADVDVALILGGRFDPARLAGATHTKTGTPIVAGTYAGFATSTAGSLTYAVLSPRTVVAGTAEGIHRVLDRAHDPHLARVLPPWMLQTLETQGAQMALGADFVSQPAAGAVLSSLNVSWLEGLHVARIVSNLGEPGFNVGGTLTYGDTEHAQAAADGARRAGQWVRTLGPLLGGVQLQRLQIEAQGADARISFSLDDRSLRALVALGLRFLPSLKP